MQGKSVFVAVLALCASMMGEGVARAADSWEVKGISPEQVLNVRSQADGKSPLVGALPAGAHGVVVTGAAVSGWLPISYGTVKGFVSDKNLMKSPAAGAPGGLTCSGTEPFWTLQVDGHTATFDAVDAQAVKTELNAPIQPSMALDRWLYTPVTATAPITFVLVQETRRCIEGVTDDSGARRYEITLRKGNDLFAGCCERK